MRQSTRENISFVIGLFAMILIIASMGSVLDILPQYPVVMVHFFSWILLFAAFNLNIQGGKT